MIRATAALISSVFLLSACEPERGIRSDRDFYSEVSVNCVDQALRKTFGQIERWDYVSEGRNFPKGTSVAQFAYYRSADRAGWATIEIGSVGSRIRISHAFTGIGSELPQEHFPPALDAMRKASEALKAACRVNLEGMEMKEIGQEVDGLR